MTTKKRDLNQGKKKSATLEKRAAPMTFGAAAAMSSQQLTSEGNSYEASRTTDSLKAEQREMLADKKAELAQVGRVSRVDSNLVLSDVMKAGSEDGMDQASIASRIKG